MQIYDKYVHVFVWVHFTVVSTQYNVFYLAHARLPNCCSLLQHQRLTVKMAASGTYFDPQTDVWTAVAPMSVSRDAVGVCLLGDRLFAVGGYDGQVYLNTVEAYDPQTNEWTQVYTQTHTY